MNLYPNRHGAKINIGFTFNNKTPWFMRAKLYNITLSIHAYLLSVALKMGLYKTFVDILYIIIFDYL